MKASRSPTAAAGRFVTTAVTQGYAPLDRYLMGFAPPGDVPDTFVVLNPSVSPLGHPQSGVAFTGNRLNISANDVIQAMGRRTPDYTVAQHRFRFGFILVVPQGAQDASIADSVQQVETYRQQFVAAYTKFSANLAAADTTLNRSLRLSLFPAAGVVAGGSATATISVQTPPKTDLVVRLAAPAGFAQVPAQVTIAAGATSAIVYRHGNQGRSGGTAGHSRRFQLRNCLRARAGGRAVATHAAEGSAAIPFQEPWRCS